MQSVPSSDQRSWRASTSGSAAPGDRRSCSSSRAASASFCEPTVSRSPSPPGTSCSGGNRSACPSPLSRSSSTERSFRWAETTGHGPAAAAMVTSRRHRRSGSHTATAPLVLLIHPVFCTPAATPSTTLVGRRHGVQCGLRIRALRTHLSALRRLEPTRDSNRGTAVYETVRLERCRTRVEPRASAAQLVGLRSACSRHRRTDCLAIVPDARVWPERAPIYASAWVEMTCVAHATRISPTRTKSSPNVCCHSRS